MWLTDGQSQSNISIQIQTPDAFLIMHRNRRCPHIFRGSFHDAGRCFVFWWCSSRSWKCAIIPAILPLRFRTILNLLSTGPVFVWPYSDYWANKDILFLRSETENAWDSMLYWRDLTRILEVAVRWHDCRDIWVFEFVWVRTEAISHIGAVNLRVYHRDFFPVILTFLRQLPFIGNLLSLPYIREVSQLRGLHRARLT
jgi:hypothetical protein